MVAKCGEPNAGEEARKFRLAADSNGDFLAVLFNAIRWNAAADTAPAVVAPPAGAVAAGSAPGAVGDQAAAVRSGDDESMARAPKRSADEAQLPVPSILLEREKLLATLWLEAAAAAVLADDDKDL